MFWAAVTILLAVVTASVMAAFLVARRRVSARDRSADESFDVSTVILGGLSQAEQAGFHRIAQADSRRERAGWLRDYFVVAGSDRPGRVSGLPRELRVRR